MLSQNGNLLERINFKTRVLVLILIKSKLTVHLRLTGLKHVLKLWSHFNISILFKVVSQTFTSQFIGFKIVL